MKKIALTSLLAMVAVTGANAANVINGNPLYKPAEGHFASVTSLDTSMFQSSDSVKDWTLSEEFGYGITDALTAYVYTDASEIEGFDSFEWNSLGAGVDYRLFNMDGWVLDLGGYYTAYNLLGTGDIDYHFDKDRTSYFWNYGLQTGYMSDCFTIAGYAYMGYMTGWGMPVESESFNWNDEGVHTIDLGVDAQFVLTDWVNLVAGVGYMGVLDDEAENAGSWTGKIGANFNIDETKFIGVYATTGLEHENGESSWKMEKSMGLGVKFGIDF